MSSKESAQETIVEAVGELYALDEADFSERLLASNPSYTMPPMRDAYLALTLTWRKADKTPRPNLAVRIRTEPATFTGPSWRDPSQFTSRWPASSAQKLLQRINDGTVRLQSTLDKTNATTNAEGKITIRVYAWHFCGEEADPASDNVIFEWDRNERHVLPVWCGMKSLVAMADEVGWNVRLAGGIRGRYAMQTVVDRMKKIGLAWDDVEEAPKSTEFPLYITDASIRWGGLYPPHLTHRFGGSLDLRVPSTDGGPSRPGAANYDREGVIWLCKLLSWQGATEIRFADSVPGVTVVDATHQDHIHVSFLQKPSEPWLTKPGPKLLGRMLR